MVAPRRIVEMRRRPELGADVVHGQIIGGDGDAMLLVGEGLTQADDPRDGDAGSRWAVLEVGKPLAERSAGSDRVG